MPGQRPIDSSDTRNCSVRQALNWCYTQPRWETGTVASCLIKMPKMSRFTIRAPLVFDPAALSPVPVSITLDFGGAIVDTRIVNGLSGIFLTTNVSRRWTNTSSSSSVLHRRLANANLDKLDPFDVNLQSGIELANCTVMGFGDPTRLGGAMRVENIAHLTIRNVVFSGNFGRHGGGIYVANVGVTSISNTRFVSNTASRSGGGAFIINSTTVRVLHSRFDGNIASVVGAGLVVDHAWHAALVGNAFLANQAGGFGGGLSLNDIYGTTSYSTVANSTFTSNRAYYGSMMALGGCRRLSIDQNVGRLNSASRGCGVFWLYSTMSAPRNLVNNRSNVFVGNSAPYGPDYGTEGRVMVAQPRAVHLVDYTTSNKIDASAVVQDYYGQLVNDDLSTASVMLKTGAPINCRFNNLRAGVFGNIDAQLVAGVARFNFKPVCIPGGSINITYIMYMSRLAEMFPYYDAVQVNAPIKIITTDAFVTFRRCLTGEKYDFFTADKDSCTLCTNSYSMFDNADLSILSCKPCPPRALLCYSDQIILPAGAWRWNHFATTIFTCPFTSFGCAGGNASGLASCNVGYIGPVCGICEWGYFASSDNTKCLVCDRANFFQLPVIVILTLLGALIIYIVYSIHAVAAKRKMSTIDALFFIAKGGETEDENYTMTKVERLNKKKRRSWISRAKIFLATYQVIISSPSTFNINFGPVFTAFINMLKVINFDFVAFLPIQCFSTFHYVQSMFSSSGIPLLIVCFFVVMCNAQVWWQLSLESDRMRRRRRVGEIMSRYMMVGVAILSFVMTSVTAKVFKIFDCFDVDPNHEAGDGLQHRFLRIDVATDCSSAEYKLGYSWALLMIIVYPISVPASFFYLLYTNRAEIYGRGMRTRALTAIEAVENEGTEAERREAQYKADKLREKVEKMNLSGGGVIEGLSFLYEQYQPEWWFWDLVETVRKLSLTSILSILDPGTPMQCTFSVLLAIVYVKLYGACSPFIESNDNLFAEIGQYQVFVTFFAVLVLMQNSLGDHDEHQALYSMVDALLVAANTTMIGLLMSILWKETKQEREMERLEAEKDKQREIEKKQRRKANVVKESNDETTAREVQEVLAALKRHPTVLEQLAARLKTAAPEGARRRAKFLDEFDLSELQTRIQLSLGKVAARRNAVQMTAEDLVRGRLLRQPRRRAMLHMDREMEAKIQAFYGSEAFADMVFAKQQEDERSSSSEESAPQRRNGAGGGGGGGARESDDDSSLSVSTRETDEAARANGRQLQLERPAFDDDSDALSSLQSYETPSTPSEGGGRGSRGGGGGGAGSDSDASDGHDGPFDLREYLAARAQQPRSHKPLRSGGGRGKGRQGSSDSRSSGSGSGSGGGDDDSFLDRSVGDLRAYRPGADDASLDDDDSWGGGGGGGVVAARRSLAVQLAAQVVDEDDGLDLDAVPGEYVDARPDSKGSVLSKVGIDLYEGSDLGSDVGSDADAGLV